ncbi:DUF6924 domain-containing protein [Streptomyces virginiae]|uniref:DUF6924 domain-containing protein n=1 Tax=Streptomyces virginiae TaxID=1961 RepID=UPI002DDA8892|nr:hypothetical protein [Streptomyces virginiae]WSC79339.1 hypothetical protein OHA56_25150 [Streptomyces virginiae]
MRPPLPPVAERDEFEALIIRTDYADEQAWQAVTAALTQPWGNRDIYVVDDPAWSGASVDEVLQAVSADEELSVFFLADHVTMRSPHHALLAVTAVPEEEYEGIVEFGREFRTTPAGVHDIHANLSIANMDFEDYAAAAHEDPEKVFSSF